MPGDAANSACGSQKVGISTDRRTPRNTLKMFAVSAHETNLGSSRRQPYKLLCQPNPMAQWHRLAQFHSSTRKNPLQSSARAVRCAKLGTSSLGFRKSLAHSRKTQLPKGSHRRAGLLAPSGKTGLSPTARGKAKNHCGRFRRQQRIARCCAGRYRHVLILFVHIYRGRGEWPR
jgi:hypothetical protein